MRTVSTAQEDVLTTPVYDVKLRVEVENSTGTFINLSALGGADWVEGADWGYNLDQPVPEIRIGIRRDITGTDSLAPLVEDSSFNIAGAATSYAALLDAGRELKLYTATVARGAAAPASGAFDFMSWAEIDEVQWGKSPIQVVARSKIMSQLADRWIETETEYGSPDPTGGDSVSIESVIQSILDDWTDGTITLWTPSSPSFNISPVYRQQKMSVLSAITQLVQLIGWDCREVWDDGTSAFRLKLYEPARAASTGDKDWTFSAAQYYDVNRLDISRADVRNVVTVLYTSGVAASSWSSVIAEDTGSADRFGRRWMEMQEGGESSINSSSEANTLATAALNDLKDPLADQEIVHPYFWPVELQDYHEYLANDVHYSTDQFWAIYGLRHTLNARETRTRMMVRGKPAGQYLGWATKQGGIASTGLPLALTNIVLDSHPGTLLSGFPITVTKRYVQLAWQSASTLVRSIACKTYTLESTDLEQFWIIDTSSQISGRNTVALASLTSYSSETIRCEATPYNVVSTSTSLLPGGSSQTLSTSTGAHGPTLTDDLASLTDTPEMIVKAYPSTTFAGSAPPNASEWYVGNILAIGPGLAVDNIDTLLPQYSLHYQVSTAPVSTAAHGDPSPGQLFFQVTSSAP